MEQRSRKDIEDTEDHDRAAKESMQTGSYSYNTSKTASEQRTHKLHSEKAKNSSVSDAQAAERRNLCIKLTFFHSDGMPQC
eukprot:scaffold158578_cov21-Tisochrysis_lutea.AAC.1